MPTDMNQIIASHAMLRLLMLEATGQRHPAQDADFVPAGNITAEMRYLRDLLAEIDDAHHSDEFLSEVIAEFYRWTGDKPDEVKRFHQILATAGLLHKVADPLTYAAPEA